MKDMTTGSGRWLRMVTMLLPLLSMIFISADISEGLSLELLPQTVSLVPGGSTSLTLIARNTTQDTIITDPVLEIYPLEGIQIEIIEGPTNPSISPESFARWQIKLMHINSKTPSNTIYFQVSYFRAGSGNSRIKDTVLTSLEISIVPPPNLAEQAIISIQSPITALNENQAGWLYVSVTNSSYDPIRVKKITIQNSEDLEIGYPDTTNEGNIKSVFSFDLGIPGYHTEVIPFMVQTKERVDPKDVILLINVQIESQNNGLEYSASLLETYTVKVGVLGESDILKVLTAVPSLLLLPGFVFLLGLAMIAKFTIDDSLFQKLPLKVASVEFWIVSISISLLAATLFGSTAFLDKYNFNDIRRVWFISFLAGVFGGLALWGIVEALKSKRARDLALITPTVNDTALELLDKLVRQGFSTKLKRVKIKEDNQEVFLLQPEGEDQQSYMVGPRIMVIWKIDKDEALYDRAQQLNDEDQDLSELMRLIRFGLRDETGPSIINVEFDFGGNIKMPIRKNKSDLLLEGEYVPFVEFDEQ